MGGTGWHHIGEYAGSIAESLEAVQREVFSSGKYQYFVYREVFDRDTGQYFVEEGEAPRTFEEFWASEESSRPEGGTHSILDVNEIREAGSLRTDLDTRRWFGGMYPLDAAETMRYFGTLQPTRSDFDRVGFRALSDSAPARHLGRCVVLHDHGQPAAVAFWGSSGT